MNPGDSVASPRSTTWAPCGIARLLPASTILSPWTITTPFVTSAFDLPSNRRAALRTIVGAGSAATAIPAQNTETAEKRQTSFFMASDMKSGGRKQSCSSFFERVRFSELAPREEKENLAHHRGYGPVRARGSRQGDRGEV